MQYTFLELVRMTARESGTIPGSLPETVFDQTGRIQKIVHWVHEAWIQIQNRHAFWDWMHDEFVGVTSPGINKYSHLQFGIQRFARWIDLPDTITIRRMDLPLSDEQFIHPLERWRFRRLYEVGEPYLARPSCFCLYPNDMLAFGPTPDDEYVVRGEYYKSPQELVNNDDVPELPQRFRPIIAWYALVLLSEHDEAGLAMGTASRNYRQYLGDLEADQLPKVSLFRRLV